jgi:hypothetical protein
MSDRKRASEKLVFGVAPRANLLPPEFMQEAALRRQRRSLGSLAVLAIIVVALAYGYATFGAAASAQHYKDALAETDSLLSQQKEYSDVSSMQGRIAAIKAAQIVGAAPEINWKSYLELVRASLPSGTSMNTIGAKSVAPGAVGTASNSPLQGDSICTLDFVVDSKTLPDVSAWIDNLALLPGFADAVASSIAKLDNGSYTVTVTMHVNAGALSHRFDADAAATADEADATDTGDDASTTGDAP